MNTRLDDMKFGQYFLKNEKPNLPRPEVAFVASRIIDDNFKPKKTDNIIFNERGDSYLVLN